MKTTTTKLGTRQRQALMTALEKHPQRVLAVKGGRANDISRGVALSLMGLDLLWPIGYGSGLFRLTELGLEAAKELGR